jgi:hypothetical protein
MRIEPRLLLTELAMTKGVCFAVVMLQAGLQHPL